MKKNKSSEAFFFKNQLLIAQSLPSTNSYLLQSNIEKDVFLFTHQQNSGKGQRGNTWHSEDSKNLCCSIALINLNLELKQQFYLSKAVALAVHELLSSYIDPAKLWIKWPNDIYVGSKKIAGILLENMCLGNMIQKSIIGIGININQEKFEGLGKATSLKIENGESYDLFSFFYPLFSILNEKVRKLEGNVQIWDKAYEKKMYRRAVWAFYEYQGHRIEAVIEGVNEFGYLYLKTRNGCTLSCDIKEIRFVE